MNSLFERELLAMEREILDLKTHCRKGLGLTRFYSKTIEIEASAGVIYNFTATTVNGEPSPAFITIFFTTNPYVRYATGTTATAYSRTFSFLTITQSTRLTVKAVSTSKLNLEQTQ